MGKLEKKFEEMLTAIENTREVNKISTDIIGLDYMLGGGLPEGFVVEIYGPKGTGKTTLCLELAHTFAKRGENVLFVNPERSVKRSDVRRSGLPEVLKENNAEVMMYEDNVGENIMELLRKKVAEERKYPLVLLDSVASVSPSSLKKKLQENPEHPPMASKASFWAAYWSDIREIFSCSPLLDEEGKETDRYPTCVFVDQVRSKVNSPMGGKQPTSGDALGHLFESQIELRYYQKLEKKTGARTVEMRIVEKSRIAPPNRTTLLDIAPEGIHRVGSLIDIGRIDDSIKVKGGGYYYLEESVSKALDVGPTLGRGPDGVREFLENNPDAHSKLYNYLWENICWSST